MSLRMGDGFRRFDFAMRVEIERPAETIWPYLIDWENLDRWMSEARDFRVVGDRREGVGVEAEATISIGGIRTRDRVRVTQWEPPSVLEIEHLGWVKGRGYMELSPSEQGSFFFWRESLEPPWGFLGKLGMKLLKPVIRGTFRRDAWRLKEIVERET
jgi:uncharacterized membrane protein